MKRREALLGLGYALFFPRILFGERKPKFILIHDSDERGTAALIERANAYLSPRDSRWWNKVVSWHLERDSSNVRKFLRRYAYATKTFQWPLLVVVPGDAFLIDEVEVFSVEWLRAEASFEKACYPISGGWWSVDGDFHPTIEKVRKHVFEAQMHKDGKFLLEWLELLKFEEIQSLHSDHHREMIKQGKVHWKNVNAECPVESVDFL